MCVCERQAGLAKTLFLLLPPIATTWIIGVMYVLPVPLFR